MGEVLQVKRHIAEIIGQSKPNKIFVLTGARQAGKTTLAKNLYHNLKYINLDSAENRETLRMLPAVNWGKDVGTAIIDEAQKEPAVFDKIKYSYDDKGISFSVLLGSSQILLLKQIRETLAGRCRIFELFPLMLCELTGQFTPLLSTLITAKGFEKMPAISSVLLDKAQSVIQKAEQHLLTWGGMPALLHESDTDKKNWLKDYEFTYLERDLGDLARIHDLLPFRKFQKLSALRSACLLNYSDLARDAGLSVDTAKRYLEYLRISYQVILLQPYYRNITSSVIKTPKLYWLDIGLLRQLTGNYGEVTGEIFETMVISEIYKWIKTAQADANLYYYRTRSGLEADAIIETPAGIIGIEIKSRQTISSSDSKVLRTLAEHLQKQWIGGIVIYRGNTIHKICDPNIWAIPANRLLTGF